MEAATADKAQGQDKKDDEKGGLATEDDVGLSAAVLFVMTFTFYLTVSMITRPFDGEPI